jgi:hypothetical protein
METKRKQEVTLVHSVLILDQHTAHETLVHQSFYRIDFLFYSVPFDLWHSYKSSEKIHSSTSINMMAPSVCIPVSN